MDAGALLFSLLVGLQLLEFMAMQWAPRALSALAFMPARARSLALPAAALEALTVAAEEPAGYRTPATRTTDVARLLEPATLGSSESEIVFVRKPPCAISRRPFSLFRKTHVLVRVGLEVRGDRRSR